MHWTPETRIKPFAGLPAELRLIIYAHVMDPEPSPNRRALIEVLKHSRALNDDLEKALENSENISLFADRHDWKRFIELRSYPLLETWHFTLRWGSWCQPRFDVAIRDMEAMTITKRNNLESITIHFAMKTWRDNAALCFAYLLIGASTQLSTFLIQFGFAGWAQGPETAEHAAMMQAVRRVGVALGIGGKKDEASPIAGNMGEVWVWQNEGKRLCFSGTSRMAPTSRPL